MRHHASSNLLFDCLRWDAPPPTPRMEIRRMEPPFNPIEKLTEKRHVVPPENEHPRHSEKKHVRLASSSNAEYDFPKLVHREPRRTMPHPPHFCEQRAKRQLEAQRNEEPPRDVQDHTLLVTRRPHLSSAPTNLYNRINQFHRAACTSRM